MVATPFLTSVGSRLAKKIEKRQTIVDAETMVPDAAARGASGTASGSCDRRRLRQRGASAGARAARIAGAVRHHHAQSRRRGRSRIEGLPVIRGDASKQLTLQIRRHPAREDDRRFRTTIRRPRIASPRSHANRPSRARASSCARADLTEIEPLTKAGVDRVVAEELESIVQLFAEVLRNYQVAPEEIETARSHHPQRRLRGAARRKACPSTPVVVCNIPGGCAPDGTPLARVTPAVEERAMRRKIDTQKKVTLETHVSKGGVRSSRSNPSGVAERERLRGLPAYRRLVGPSAHLHDVRSHGLLRFVAEPACHEAPSRDRSSDRPIDGARRRLGLVLHRRGGR